MSILNEDGWTALYVIFGAIYLILGVIYLVMIIGEFRTDTPKMPGYKAAQVAFTGSTIFRGAGTLMWGIIVKVFPDNDWMEKHQWVDTLLNGLPGYFLTISYCLMFFLWCSISVNLLINDTSDFYDRLRNGTMVLLGIVGAIGFALIVTMITNSLQETTVTSNAHQAEIWFAVIRDVFSSSWFIHFTYNISRKLTSGICSPPSSETEAPVAALCRMSYGVALSMIVRAASILIYFYSFVHKKDDAQDSRWGTGSIVNTLIGNILSELAPILIIFFGRKKSGLLSVYDPIPA